MSECHVAHAKPVGYSIALRPSRDSFPRGVRSPSQNHIKRLPCPTEQRMIVKHLRFFSLGLTVCAAMAMQSMAQEPETPAVDAPAADAPTADAPTVDTPAAEKPASALSYYIGLSIGEQMRAQGLTDKDVDANSIAMAIADELAGRKPRLAEAELAEAQKAVITLIQAREEAARAKMQAEMENAAAANQEKGALFLAENGKKQGVKTLPSGLQYKSERQGNGASPTLENVVRVHYTGRLISGEVFDSSVERGEPAEFQVGQLIKGWQEALPRMKVGDKWTLYVPASLAYGMRGSPPKIGPNELLVFEMELLGIVK
jgi:FKBP-type peptidyl-prolyl cis-trans isomerase FklB